MISKEIKQEYYLMKKSEGDEQAEAWLNDQGHSVLDLITSPIQMKNQIIQKKSVFNVQSVVQVGLHNMKPREFIFKRFNIERGNLINYNLPLFGQFKTEPGVTRVLHIDQEQTEKLTQRRYERLSAGLVLANYKIDRVVLPFNLNEYDKMPREEIKQELINLCKNYDVVVLDSLRRAYVGDENSSDILADVLSLLKTVAEVSNTAFIFISHKGKSNSNSAKQSSRGTSAIYDVIDVQIDLDSADGVVEFECAKNRDGIYFDGFKYIMKDEGDFIENQNCTTKLCFELLEGKVKPKNSDRQKEVLESIKNSQIGQLNSTQLRDSIKCDKNYLPELVANMVQQKLIIETISGKAKLYSLGENAQSYMDWS